MDVGPGDRVIALQDVSAEDAANSLMARAIGHARINAGQIYTVQEVRRARRYNSGRSVASCGLVLVESDTHWTAWNGVLGSWSLSYFRKLPDISEWLETSTGYEEPRRVPAPREVEGV